ncbi:MAG: 4Fe-4S binding protein [Eubacteriales bacterium]|nr:4Fe-4S binding protein [Eubacteriales bacterium]
MSSYNITFSPTGGTQKAADLFTKAFSNESESIDLTDRNVDFHTYAFHADDICIVAVPSYGGRVPDIAVVRLKQMKGNGARAILMVVYGNRDYDDTFVELQDTLEEAGFVCVAAVAAIAEHSIMRQFAAGRPDAQDAEELAGFAKTIRVGIEAGTLASGLTLPGNRPYKEYGGVPMKPQTGKSCTQCGICAKSCPVGAIDEANPSQTNAQACILCMRCVAVCPQNARSINKVLLAGASMKLKKACAGHKKNELFLPN